MTGTRGGFPAVADLLLRLPTERAGHPAPADVLAKREQFALPQAEAAVAFRDQVINGVPSRIVEGADDVVVIYLHGGGYWSGDAVSYTSYAHRLGAVSGATIVLANYRLAPEHPYPAAVRDAFAVYAGLRQADGDRRIVMAGDSAGGGLAAAVSVAADICGVARPDGQALLSPWLDLRCTASSYRTATDPNFNHAAALRARSLYLGAEAEESGLVDHPLVSPLRADPAIFPPTLVQVGATESLLSDALAFRSALDGAGVPCTTQVVSGQGHIWPVLAPDHADARAADDTFGRFVSQFAAIGGRGREDRAGAPLQA